MPNTWFKNVPGTFYNLNRYIHRWDVGNGMYFRCPSTRTGIVIIEPLDEGKFGE